MPDYDLITVGGGLGGAALAKVLAEKGLRVLVIEREREFKDRVRGEIMWPWGVAEVVKLGLYDRLLETSAHEVPYLKLVGSPLRDFRNSTPQKLPGISFYHPAMQEVVLEAAKTAGAHVKRGASVREVTPGKPPIAAIEENGTVSNVTARMVVCADGKSSMGRGWGNFAQQRGKQRLLGAGVLLDDMRIADDTSLMVINPALGQEATLFPQGKGRVRFYLIYSPQTVARLHGEADAPRLIQESIRTGIPPEYFNGARVVPPLASFDMTEHWVEHPYRDGVALVGDAAGASDPSWGQGLSMTVRDVRVLSENLLASEDWEAAGHAYARARDDYFKADITVEDWYFELFLRQGPEADARRARALPLVATEPDRAPDHFASGPDLPCDDRVRQRFFGEK